MKPKLVRDKIPEIIEKAEGVKAIIITLNKKDYGERLVEKIREEAEELLLAIKDNTNSIEELADILELINAIAIYVGGSISDVEKERKKKFKIRGGFKKRYLLLGKASE
ncbi:phosphoribosyl-ATP pyrophosphohydrolase [candidate division WWE3 bacterium CG08_land_8_20_14_0_20_41_10]|uniref:Phosphoribosyl-ATP pyrophosphohydrolase n=1 Tax=candidate division WWE3 bacterium CG08_land_8_20_14_0_20_41_10 TaxID=1975085 RepID=A0A2H0XD02_UNCKA|nr:MAG: phosphoribosyl-ATP pyrophosphohydrolase [candidate division WWE3 bacterium CG08_land_8_20_14_0_20_41_10]